MNIVVEKSEKYFNAWVTIGYIVLYALLMTLYQTNIAEFRDVKNLEDAIGFISNHHAGQSIVVIVSGVVLYILAMYLLCVSLIGLFGVLAQEIEHDNMIYVIIDCIIGVCSITANFCVVKSFWWIILAIVIIGVVIYAIANN